jgi:Mor family transcriptional regulator
MQAIQWRSEIPMPSKLTQAEEDEIRRLKFMAREATDKALMKRYKVSRKTIYNAVWRAEQRTRETIDTQLPEVCTSEVA